MADIKTTWFPRTALERLAAEWDSQPDTPGVYVILSGRPMPRAAAIDDQGVLYIGKSSNLRSRLWSFWYAEHSASGFLWRYPEVASRLLAKPDLSTKEDVEAALGLLDVRMAPSESDRLAVSAERSLLFAYLEKYGELPPLNAVLPDRWGDRPTVGDLDWASRSLATLQRSDPGQSP